MSEQDVDVIKLFQEAALEVSGRKLDNLTLDTPLADLALDSVLVLEVVSHVEQRLSIRFDDEDLSRIQTMRDLGALIQKARRAA
ncbi:MAG TPA: acyl carrier protein [Haliangiales bacterium]|nr:acyl carrier protein [Haliangiales bacterium]